MEINELRKLVGNLDPMNENAYLENSRLLLQNKEAALPFLLEAMVEPRRKKTGKTGKDNEDQREGVILTIGRTKVPAAVKPLIALWETTRAEDWSNKIAIEGRIVQALREIGGEEVRIFFTDNFDHLGGMMAKMTARGFLRS